MRKVWLACAALLAASQADAQAVNGVQPWTQIGDANGNSLGTPTNPLYVSGGTGGGSGGAVTVGADKSAAQHQLLTDVKGGLQPGQGVSTSTQASTVASTATQLVAANANRTSWELEIETALTAPLYVCTNGQTGCSATVHDRMIASGAAAGTLYTPPQAPVTAIYYFTTQAGVVLNQTSWTPN